MRRFARALLVMTALLIGIAATPAHATGLYPEQTLTREAPRLKRAISRIYNEGIVPTLRPKEAALLKGVRFSYPLPKPDDPPLNFYAGDLNGAATVVLPLQSLKLVEDLTTAFAWLYVEKRGFGPLDLYFAMLQRKPHEELGGPGHRDILRVLAVLSGYPRLH